MMTGTPLIMAYCAGVIDSDGYIGIKRNTYSMRVTGDSKQPSYSERVCVKQVEPQAVILLQRIFGGTLYLEKPSLENGKPLYSWGVTDRKAYNFIKSIVPYLRIKKEQAKNCIGLRRLKERSLKQRLAFGRGHIGGAPRDQAVGKQMEARYINAKRLNQVGTTGLPQKRIRATGD